MTARPKGKRRTLRVKRRSEHRPATPVTREQRQQTDHTRMLGLIAATKAQAEREAELDWRLSRALEGSYTGPMLGELLGGDDDLATRIGEPSPTLARGTTVRRQGR